MDILVEELLSWTRKLDYHTGRVVKWIGMHINGLQVEYDYDLVL